MKRSVWSLGSSEMLVSSLEFGGLGLLLDVDDAAREGVEGDCDWA